MVQRIIKKKKVLFAALVLSVLLSVADNANVYAISEKGSITIRLEDIGTSMEKVVFSVYPVAGLSDDGESYWNLDGRLTDVKINEIRTSEESQNAAERLEKQISQSGITGREIMTDSSGQSVCDNLAPGLYLIVQEKKSSYGEVAPFLADLPHKQDGEWTYTAEACPKGQRSDIKPTVSRKPSRSENVKTEDATNPERYMSMLVVSGLLCIGFLLKKAREGRAEK